jgi:hypothetical protein
MSFIWNIINIISMIFSCAASDTHPSLGIIACSGQNIGSLNNSYCWFGRRAFNVSIVSASSTVLSCRQRTIRGKRTATPDL